MVGSKVSTQLTAGEEMDTDKKMVGAFGTFNNIIYEDLQEINKTLDQIGVLSIDATDQLYDGLDEIGVVFNQHVEIVESVVENNDVNSDELKQKLAEGQAYFKKQKSQILRSMQATDMVQQLLGHCRTRMNRIRKMSGEIESVTNKRMEAFSLVVNDIQNLLQDTQMKLDNDVEKAVKQISVDESDVEFF